MLNKLLKGVSAGILISIGGTVFLSCKNKVVGAVLFTVALLCICYNGYSLYTGKICFMPYEHDKEQWSVLLLGLIGNLIATAICGYLIRYALPGVGAAAQTICNAKLEQTVGSAFIRGIFCGILIYLAVVIYKQKGSALGIIFCIPTFILSGFEHSIADMFYFAASGIVTVKTIIFILIIIAGNTVGGCLLPVMEIVSGGKNDRK